MYITDIAKWCAIRFGDIDANPLYYAHSLYLNNELVTELVIPEGVTSIGDYAFTGCTSLMRVTIPSSVISIGSSAFNGCSSLISITIPDSVTSIGSSAFKGCSSLISITIPNRVTSIGYDAFDGCPIEKATIPALCIYYIPQSKLKEVAITSGDSIGGGAFNGCTSLTSVIIGDSVTSIGESAFKGCSSLTSVIIGSGVTSIESSAFSGCTELSEIFYKGTSDNWYKIEIDNYLSGNDTLSNAIRYYYSETEPTDSGNYWHYVDGVVTKW